jgi:hypothetical protein
LGPVRDVPSLRKWSERHRQNLSEIQADVNRGRRLAEREWRSVGRVYRKCRDYLGDLRAGGVPPATATGRPDQLAETIELLAWAVAWCDRPPAKLDLKPGDVDILRAIAEHAPATVLLYDLHGVSRRTLTSRLRWFKKKRLIAYPRGPRGGVALTDLGRSLLPPVS